MRITTETEYALIIMLHLVRRGAGQPAVSARQIAEDESLPSEFVEQILLRLRRAELVESVRGAKGGYRVAREGSEVSLFEVMAVTERQPFETACERHAIDEGRCGPGKDCSIRPVWFALQRQIDGFLGGISLNDLLDDEGTVRDLVSLGRS
jgi:Rrf2 family protein